MDILDEAKARYSTLIDAIGTALSRAKPADGSASQMDESDDNSIFAACSAAEDLLNHEFKIQRANEPALILNMRDACAKASAYMSERWKHPGEVAWAPLRAKAALRILGDKNPSTKP
jgi:hypothetical protein